MTRPYVQINADNQSTMLREHLRGMLPRFTAFEGVVGLTLTGGLSRGYGDHLSEIDVTFYLTPDAFEAWQNGRSPIAVGITVLDGQLYDIKHVSYEAERARAWDDIALWDASYAEILYDPENRLRDLLSDKRRDGPEPDAAEGLMMRCLWYFELAGEIWIHREDVLQGHHMFNQAVTALVQALFVANGEYIPHEKWLLHLSRSLEWRPADWEPRLQAAMSTGDFSAPSLRARQESIRKLWDEVDRRLRERYAPGLPVHVMQKSTYEHLKMLADAGTMTVAEWRDRTGRDVPNGDPFYPIIRVDGDRIILDREALAQIGPEAMYAWHHAVLCAVRE